MDMSNLEPGHVIRLHDTAAADGGVYIIVSDPTAPAVMVCLAGEDGNGDVCETDQTRIVAREALAGADLLSMPPLPWPRPRVWVTD